jgi:hypothetical protein
MRVLLDAGQLLRFVDELLQYAANAHQQFVEQLVLGTLGDGHSWGLMPSERRWF